MILFDTDILTLLAFNRNEALRRRLKNSPREAILCCCVISEMEMIGGRYQQIRTAATRIDLSRAVGRLNHTIAFLRSFRQLEWNQSVVESFDRLRQDRKLKKIGRGDLLLAAFTLGHDATLVTRNLKDFRAIPGLRLENWAEG